MQKSRALKALKEAVKDKEFLSRLRQQQLESGIIDDSLNSNASGAERFHNNSSPLPATTWAEEHGLRRSLLPPQEGGLGDEITTSGPTAYPPSRGRAKVRPDHHTRRP